MKLLRKPLAAVAALFLSLPALAQTSAAQLAATTQGIVAPRIQGVIENTTRATLTGSRAPLATPGSDLGPVDPAMPLHGISLVFSRSAQQEAALQALLAAQQNPASPQYHQWLTPDQYAAQFGVADSDLAAAQSWLQQQGFSIDSVARSHNRIAFSGTAAQAASAFGAPIHNFRSPDGSTHFAPAADLTVPAALSSIVLGVANLSSFQPHPMIRTLARASEPQFTSSLSGNHFIGPGDLATMYDVKPVYQAGYTGINQSIAVIGQSSVLLSDIAAFQSAAGVTAKTPITVLLPGSGGTVAPVADDEAESDLDLEYTSTMAPGAQVYFIYTGSNTNYGAFDALIYAIDERISPIISSSYGACEQAVGNANLALLDSYFVQASAQGQTILSAAGDQNSAGCYGEYTSTDLTDNQKLAIIYPAGSANVTAMGGTEIPSASAASTNSTYWTAANGSDVIASAKSYIPEQVWNDSAVAGTADGGGGGYSVYEARPSWQTGITVAGAALPTGTFRMIPDISLVASNYNAPLLFCSSDSSAWSKGQVASCNSGFRDASSTSLTVAGGTSFDAPIFAGMLALINQALNSTGQGNINPTLYSIASSSTATYASAFHDTTVGGNQCLAGTSVCGTGAATTSYAATTGYDLASGLGSIDLYNLLSAWPKTTTAALAETVTTLSAATSSPTLGASDTITVTVKPVSGSTVPTGTVTLLIDGGSSNATNGGSSTTLTLTNGSATYSFSSNTAGAHVIVATYAGSTTFGPSTGSLAVSVSNAGTFTLTANPNALSLAAGSSGSFVLTATPAAGYVGSINLSFTYSPTSLNNFCAGDTNNGIINITSTTAASDTITLYTSASTCNSLGLQIYKANGTGKSFIRLAKPNPTHASLQPTESQTPLRNAALPAALACLLLTFGFGRRSRRLQGKLLRTSLSLAALALLSLAGFGLTACSNSAAPSSVVVNSTNTTPGTYVITLAGADSVTPTITAQTNVTLTVH
jgi:subtilase family serine protease